MPEPQFAGRLGIVQRVLTPYRVPLFEALAARCAGGVHVLAGRAADEEDIAEADALVGAQLERAHNRRLLRGPLAVYRQEGAMAWLERCQPDVVVAEANPRGLTTRQIARWMHRRGRPVLGWGLGARSLTAGLVRARDFRRRRFLGTFDAMIAYGTRAAAEYRALGIAGDRVFVCHNATAPRPGPAPERGPAFDGAPRVLFVGRLTSQKGVDVLLEACALLARAEPELLPSLRIVGDGEQRARLEALARARCAPAEFLGALHGQALAEQFRAADLFVLPNLGGLAVQEAIGHGLPIIVGAGDGTQHDLVRPDNGWHVEPGDAPSLAACIATALSDVVQLRRKGAASHRIASEEINLETMASCFLDAVDTTARRYSSK